jgi:hypothetical protein
LEKVPWAAEKNVYCAVARMECSVDMSVPLDLLCHLVLGFLC